MRTGIGEAHVDARLVGQLVELIGPVVGDGRRPADVALPVVDQNVEERVERMQPTLVGDRAEALADQSLIGAFDDHRLVKVLVPQ